LAQRGGREPDLHRLMVEAYKAKQEARELAKLYALNRFAELVARFREMYGGIVDATYSSVRLRERRTLLSHLIVERWILRKRGIYKHLTVAIVGPGGAQKTTYAVNSGIQALRAMGYPERAIERLLLLDADSIISTVEELLREGKWVPFLIFDDIGAIISKYWLWIAEDRAWHYFFSILDQVKDWCGVIIMTARDEKSIPSRMREIVNVVIEADEAITHGAAIVFMKYFPPRSRRRSENVILLDMYPPTATMPEWIWREMLRKRRELGMRRIEKLRLSMGEEIEVDIDEEGGEGEEA